LRKNNFNLSISRYSIAYLEFKCVPRYLCNLLRSRSNTLPSDRARLYNNLTTISDLIHDGPFAVLDNEAKARDEGGDPGVSYIADLVVVGLTVELLGGQAERDHARRCVVETVCVA
jgi:hypothetical protein